MSLRSQLGFLPQPFRWLTAHPAFGWAAVTAATLWIRARRQRMGLGPVSPEWLQDFERQSIKSREL